MFKKGIPEHIKGCYPNPVRPTSVSFIFVFVEMDTMLACFGAGDAKFQDQLGSIGKPKNVFLSNFNQTNPVIANETKNSALKWRIPTLGGSWVIRKQFDRNITINPENTYSTGYMMRYWIYIYIYTYMCIYIHIYVHTLFLHALVHVHQSFSVFSFSSSRDFISFPHLFDHFISKGLTSFPNLFDQFIKKNTIFPSYFFM